MRFLGHYKVIRRREGMPEAISVVELLSKIETDLVPAGTNADEWVGYAVAKLRSLGTEHGTLLADEIERGRQRRRDEEQHN